MIETRPYLVSAKAAGMADAELAAVVDVVAADPEAGAIMPGCGGARKLRVAKAGGGKSGGYRVVTYFGGDDIPVFLLTVFGKGDRDNLTKAERNALAGLTKGLRATLGPSERTMEGRMKSAYDKIAAGLEAAIAYQKGDRSQGRVATPDVKAIRAATGKSQTAFADAYRIPVGTVRDWEQRRSMPDAPARVLLNLIEAEPATVERLVGKMRG